MPFVRRAAGRRNLAGTPFVPTPHQGREAQDESKAPPLGGGTGATRRPSFTGEHGEEPPFDASEHRGTGP